MTYFLWINSHADAPSPWQMGFQDPATAAMEGIVDLHHDICFFLVTILVLVLWLGGRIVTGFHHTLQPMPERFNHHTNLELVWAILPSIIVTLIALPSLTLIYTFDDLVARPALTVKVVGFQWGWRYEMKEHVQLSLINPDHLLSLSFTGTLTFFGCKNSKHLFVVSFSFFKSFMIHRCQPIRRLLDESTVSSISNANPRLVCLSFL